MGKLDQTAVVPNFITLFNETALCTNTFMIMMGRYLSSVAFRSWQRYFEKKCTQLLTIEASLDWKLQSSTPTLDVDSDNELVTVCDFPAQLL